MSVQTYDWDMSAEFWRLRRGDVTLRCARGARCRAVSHHCQLYPLLDNVLCNFYSANIPFSQLQLMDGFGAIDRSNPKFTPGFVVGLCG